MQSWDQYGQALMTRVFSFIDWALSFAVKYMWVIALAVGLYAAKGVFKLNVTK